MSADALLADFEAGKPAALARVLSVVENHRAGFDQILGELNSRLGRAKRIGITGPPGAGKSSLATHVVRELRAAGHRVAVVAVDPTSPFTGGALLGDRVRMEQVALDPGVFIRSMATRGSLGGLATATREIADVLDAFGFDYIIIETVGVGQSELDVARIAESTVVVLVPESGDSIQTLKAGVMEIADVFVVNKSDRPGADRLRSDIELMLGMRRGSTMKHVPAHHGVDLRTVKQNPERAAAPGGALEARRDRGVLVSRGALQGSDQAGGAPPEKWTPPVLTTVASEGKGTADVLSALERHFTYLEKSGELRQRRRRRLRERVIEIVEQKVRQRLWTDRATEEWLDERLEELERGTTTPFVVAEELLQQSAPLIAPQHTGAST
jgi:LAO/AO transport system kinase